MITLVELKKAKMTALKNKDQNAQNVLGVIIGAYQKTQADKRAKNQEMTDADMVSILNKTMKELEDEKKMYENANRIEEANASQAQMDYIKGFLPKMMDENEIKDVISKLEDKSIKNVMVVFKKDYAGKADMSLVSKVAKEFQK